MVPPAAPAAPPALQRVRALAGRVAALAGWRRAGLAAGAGAAAALALPPWYALPLLPAGFVLLVWLLDGAVASARPGRCGAWTGFAFGFGYFVLGLEWLYEPFLVDAARHAWMIPFALGGLSALLALFVAATGAATAWTAKRLAIAGPGRVLLLADFWVLGEWLRSWVLSGFPWNLVGYVWNFSPAMMQPAALAGVYGLGLATLLAAAMPAVLGDARLPRRSWLALGLAVALLPAMLVGGWLRLGAAPSYAAGAADAAIVDGVRLRIVQAGIPQRLKWRRELREAHLARHVALSRSAGTGPPPTHIVWPETAVPFFLPDNESARRIAASAIPPDGLLITGTVRTGAIGPTDARQIYNSAIAVTGDADIVAVYDKAHLVPFGEYVPLSHILPLDKIVVGIGDFARGPGPRRLELPGLPAVSPVICYEAIFPAGIVAAGQRPGWLLNLTNDAWFGTGAGPRQHLAIASLRAVEQGLGLVRAAGTGISAVFDPYGRPLGQLGIGEIGVLDSVLPRPLPPTPYARFGDILPLGAVVLCLGLSTIGRVRLNDNEF